MRHFGHFHQEPGNRLLQGLETEFHAVIALFAVFTLLAGGGQGRVLQVDFLIDLPTARELLDARHCVGQVLTELVLLLLLLYDGAAQLGVQVFQSIHAGGLRLVALDHVAHLRVDRYSENCQQSVCHGIHAKKEDNTCMIDNFRLAEGRVRSANSSSSSLPTLVAFMREDCC